MLRTLIAAAVFAWVIGVVGLPLLFVGWLRGSIGPLYTAAVAIQRLALAIAGVRVRAHGQRNIPPGPCLFLANHTSAVDPVAMLISIPGRVAFLAKRELFRIPLLGTAMRLAHFLPVDRASREDAFRTARHAVGLLRNGVSLVLYPEGTRSRDGRLGVFKRGGFLIAIRAAVPVIPVTILGAERALPPGERWIRSADIEVRFHAPIAASTFPPAEREALLDRVRAAIASALPEHLRGS